MYIILAVVAMLASINYVGSRATKRERSVALFIGNCSGLGGVLGKHVFRDGMLHVARVGLGWNP